MHGKHLSTLSQPISVNNARTHSHTHTHKTSNILNNFPRCMSAYVDTNWRWRRHGGTDGQQMFVRSRRAHYIQFSFFILFIRMCVWCVYINIVCTVEYTEKWTRVVFSPPSSFLYYNYVHFELTSRTTVPMPCGVLSVCACVPTSNTEKSCSGFRTNALVSRLLFVYRSYV